MTRDNLPTGTITFLASDMEGSTRLIQDVGPAAFKEILEQHNALLRGAFGAHGATERGTQGDSFLVMFSDAPSAVAAAAEAQRALAGNTWPRDAQVRVRMGLHTGLAALGGDDYVGVDVHRVARIAAAAHGGQVLVSDATRSLAESDLPSGTSLRSLGEHKLRDIARPEHVYQLVIDGLPSDFPPIATASAVAAGNLQDRLTAFIGRDRELAELGRLLDDRRLVTLTGPGGTGKTSLAVELARARAEGFADGAWFIGLESVMDPELVAASITAALGLVSSPEAPVAGQLIAYLQGRTALLVLDNFEQVLPAATLVRDLIQAAIGVKVIVTSRAPLHLSMEQEFPVAPFAIPERGAQPEEALRNEAVRLFLERRAASGRDTTRGRRSWPGSSRSVVGWMASHWGSSWLPRGCA